MSKIIRQFEPSYIGNGWGNYVDIENMKFDIDMRPLPLVKKNINSFNIDIVDKNIINNENTENNKNNKNTKNAVTNLIIRVTSTTFVTVVFACFIYCAI
jgi:hypothetical protein